MAPFDIQKIDDEVISFTLLEINHEKEVLRVHLSVLNIQCECAERKKESKMNKEMKKARAE